MTIINSTERGGMNASITEVYREKVRGRWGPWSAKRPNFEEVDVSDGTDSALIVRRELDPESGFVLRLHSIIVQSPLIRKFLGDVFVGYQGISTKLKELMFAQPFHEFYYRWDRFQACLEKQTDLATLQHIKLLESIVGDVVKPYIERAQDLVDNEVASFDYLWTLYEPGSQVYSNVDGQDCLFVIERSNYETGSGSSHLTFTTKYVDANESGFGCTSTSLKIQSFEGVKAIDELSVIPARLCKRIDEVRENLKERGRKFAQLQGFHFKSCTGICHEPVRSGVSAKHYIEDSRVIIDADSYDKYNGQGSLKLDPLDKLPKMAPLEGTEYEDNMSEDTDNFRFVEGDYDLSADELMLCVPMVRGYSLALKKWVRFNVDDIHDITWNTQAFSRLVLPQGYKEILLALVQSQLDSKESFDDVMQGKGQGFIMLLSGDPGVGKTLTAESVAEEMKRPLYSLSAGELGSEADAIETSLRHSLEVCSKWKAVLLLDECDVFLEQRKVSELKRNKLVTVFLRLLEYYKGVMFLTTNRASTLDAAFQSRIHLSIHYPNLNFRSRKTIWRNFVFRGETAELADASSDINEEQLDTFASLELNGREIKNIVKTARLLSNVKEEPLQFEHVQTVLNVKEWSNEGDFAHSENRFVPTHKLI